MDEFLKYNKGKIEFSIPEYALVDSFRSLLKDREGLTVTSPDRTIDSLAYAELGIIWWRNSYRSPGVKAGLSKEELTHDGKVNFNVKDEWDEDSLFLEAERTFKEGFNHAEIESIITLRRGLNIANTAVKMMNRRNAKILTRGDAISDSEIVTLMNNQNLLLEMAEKIPKRLKSLTEAELAIKKEKLGIRYARGKEPITKSMIAKENEIDN